MRDVNAALLHYFAHPGGRGASGELARRALDTFLKCHVRLLVIDDLHFLRWENRDGSIVNNHLKYIVNEFPITMLRSLAPTSPSWVSTAADAVGQSGIGSHRSSDNTFPIGAVP